MKPFNIDAAKRGELIITRDGTPAKFLFHEPDADEYWRVVALVDGQTLSFSDEGRNYEAIDSDNDLFMAPHKVKREAWIALYPSGQAEVWSTEASVRRACPRAVEYRQIEWEVEE